MYFNIVPFHSNHNDIIIFKDHMTLSEKCPQSVNVVQNFNIKPTKTILFGSNKRFLNFQIEDFETSITRFLLSFQSFKS